MDKENPTIKTRLFASHEGMEQSRLNGEVLDFAALRKNFIAEQKESLKKARVTLTDTAQSLEQELPAADKQYVGCLKLARLIQAINQNQPTSAYPQEIQGSMQAFRDLYATDERGALKALKAQLSNLLGKQKEQLINCCHEICRKLDRLDHVLSESSELGLLEEEVARAYQSHAARFKNAYTQLLERAINSKRPPAGDAATNSSESFTIATLRPLLESLGGNTAQTLGNHSKLAKLIVEALDKWPKESLFTALESMLLRYSALFKEAEVASSYEDKIEAQKKRDALAQEILICSGSSPKKIIAGFDRIEGVSNNSSISDNELLPAKIALGFRIQASVEYADKIRLAGIPFESSQDLAFRLPAEDMETIIPLLEQAASLNSRVVSKLFSCNKVYQDMSFEDLKSYLTSLVSYLEKHNSHFSRYIICDPERSPENFETREKINEQSTHLQKVNSNPVYAQSFRVTNLRQELQLLLKNMGCPDNVCSLASGLLQSDRWKSNDSLSKQAMAKDLPTVVTHQELDEALEWLVSKKLLNQFFVSSKHYRLNNSLKQGCQGNSCIKIASDLREILANDLESGVNAEDAATKALCRVYAELEKFPEALTRLQEIMNKVQNFQEYRDDPDLIHKDFTTRARKLGQNRSKKVTSVGSTLYRKRLKDVKDTIAMELKAESLLVIKESTGSLLAAVNESINLLNQTSGAEKNSVSEHLIRTRALLTVAEPQSLESLSSDMSRMSKGKEAVEELLQELGSVKEIAQVLVNRANKRDASVSEKSAEQNTPELGSLPGNLKLVLPSFRVDFASSQGSFRLNKLQVDPALIEECKEAIRTELFGERNSSLSENGKAIGSAINKEALKWLSPLADQLVDLKVETGKKSLVLTIHNDLPSLEKHLEYLTAQLKKLAHDYPACAVKLVCTLREKDLYKILKDEIGDKALGIKFDATSKTVTVSTLEGRELLKQSDSFLKRTGWRLKEVAVSDSLAKEVMDSSARVIPLDPWENFKHKQAGESEINRMLACLPAEFPLSGASVVDNHLVLAYKHGMPAAYLDKLANRLSRTGIPALLKCVNDGEARSPDSPMRLEEAETVINKSLPKGAFLRDLREENNYILLSIFFTEDTKVLEQYRRELQVCTGQPVQIETTSPSELFQKRLLESSPFTARVLSQACDREGKIRSDKVMKLASYVSRATRAPSLPHLSPDLMERRSRISEAFAIDNQDTELREDAFTVESTDRAWKVGVHLIDLSFAIPYGSVCDEHARDLMYRQHEEAGNGSVNMVSRRFLSDFASFTPGKFRPAWSVYFEINKENGSIERVHIDKTMVRLSRALTYTGVDAVLNNGSTSAGSQEDKLKELAKAFSSVDKGMNGHSKTNATKLVSGVLALSDKLISEVMQSEGVSGLRLSQNGQSLKAGGTGFETRLSVTLRRAARDYHGLVCQHVCNQHFFNGPTVWEEDLQAIAMERVQAEDNRNLRYSDLHLLNCLRNLAAELGNATSGLMLQAEKDEQPAFFDMNSFSIPDSKGIVQGLCWRQGKLIVTSSDTELSPEQPIGVQIVGYDAAKDCYLLKTPMIS